MFRTCRTTACLALILASFLAGCGGKADVQFINNTSRYVDGQIGDAKFGFNPNGTSKRTVEWGGFLKSSIDAVIHYRVHATYDGAHLSRGPVTTR